MQKIVYSLGKTGCGVVNLPDYLRADDSTATAVLSSETPYLIVEESSLPAGEPKSWVLASGILSLDPESQKAELRAHAAAARYAKETDGIVVDGVKIATDETSQAKITGAYVKAARDSTFTTQWKGADDTFHALDAATILAVGDAVATHVAACFATEASVTADIESGTIKTVADVDAAFV